MEIVVYKPKHEIKTTDGVFYIDSDKADSFCKDWEEKKSVKIGDCRIATYTIISVKPAMPHINALESMLANESEIVKVKVREKIKEREAEKKENTDAVIQNIIKHFRDQYGISEKM